MSWDCSFDEASEETEITKESIRFDFVLFQEKEGKVKPLIVYSVPDTTRVELSFSTYLERLRGLLAICLLHFSSRYIDCQFYYIRSLSWSTDYFDFWLVGRDTIRLLQQEIAGRDSIIGLAVSGNPKHNFRHRWLHTYWIVFRHLRCQNFVDGMNYYFKELSLISIGYGEISISVRISYYGFYVAIDSIIVGSLINQ